MLKHIVRGVAAWLAALVMLGILPASTVRAQQLDQILRGYEIAANQGIPLNLRGKVGSWSGSAVILVNTTGCNDCHTHPNWTPTGNPFNGQPEQINTTQYLSGGREFLTRTGSIIATSANITPDKHDRPAGLTLAGYLEVMHTGHDPRDPPGDLLQVMSWPLYRWKTDSDLIAIYEYLRAIPSLPDNPNPGP